MYYKDYDNIISFPNVSLLSDIIPEEYDEIRTLPSTLEQISIIMDNISDDFITENEITRNLQILHSLVIEGVQDNFDSFIQESGILTFLFDHLNSNTEHCILILNMVAWLTKNSPLCYEIVYDHSKRLVKFLYSPYLRPRILAIFNVMIEDYPEIIQIFAQKIHIFVDLALKTRDTICNSAILTLISVILDHLEFSDEETNVDCVDHLITIESWTEDQLNRIVYLIQEFLKDLNTKSTYYLTVLNNNIYVQIFKILDRFLFCFGNMDNLQNVIPREVEESLKYIFLILKNKDDQILINQYYSMFPRLFAVFNRILMIKPNYFLPEKNWIVEFGTNFQCYDLKDEIANCENEYVEELFRISVNWPQYRIDSLFLLSNLVKNLTIDNHILYKYNNFLFARNEELGENSIFSEFMSFSYHDKEFAFIILLTIMSNLPQRFIDGIEIDNFSDFIDDAIEAVISTSSVYFVTVFLDALFVLFSKLPDSLSIIDSDSMIECLNHITENFSSEDDLDEKAQCLLTTYYPMIDEI